MRKLFIAALFAALLPAPAALAYGWPLKPFHRQHPIRGYFGDPRTVFYDAFDRGGLFGGGAFSFHNGLDISALPGQPVYPVVSGTAHVKDMASVDVRAGTRVFQYKHITPDVFDGQHVRAYKTVLGHVDGVEQHVHLSEIDGGTVVNPLGTHHLKPYRDRTKPKVGSLLLLGRGDRQLKTRGATGVVELAANVYDRPALRVFPAAWAGVPVAPAWVRWSLKDSAGRDVVPLTTVADFRYTIPPNKAFWRVYARGTYQNKPRFGLQQLRDLPGEFDFRLTRRPLDTRTLLDGLYQVKVIAQDTAGNRVVRTQSFRVCNADPASCATPSP